MCGIVGGVFKPGYAPNAKRIESSLDTLAHRGPDDRGYFSERGYVLGNTRLSIQDITDGHQPFYSDDGDVVVIQNGEIFNHLELRDELLSLGIRCATRCDTEVILKLYEREGLGFLNKLNGMFAIAIYDRRKESVFLIRDRIGVKPLFVSRCDSGIVFGSEVKALIRLGAMSIHLDQQALSHYLSLNYVPPPLTLFQGVNHVMPGTVTCIRFNEITSCRWWQLPTESSDLDGSSSAWKDECLSILDDATRLRLRSDAPVGAFLSGGLDSSTIVGLATRSHDSKLPVFSIGFDDPRFDESLFAQEAANRFGALMKSKVVVPDMLDDWSNATYFCDQPHGDVSFLPTWEVAKLASKDVKVVLTGDGGDELFAGYMKYLHFFEQWPVKSPSQDQWFSAYWPTLTLFPENEKSRLLLNWSQDDVQTFDFVHELVKPFHAHDIINQALIIDTLLLLPGNNLVKPDRMGMAASVEARTPFLDVRMVEFAFKTRGVDKLSENQTKKCLKSAVRDLIGDNLTYRKKQMFTVPVGDWFKKERYDYVNEHLRNLDDLGLLDMTRVFELLHQHASNTVNRTRELRALVALSHWKDRFL